MRYRGLPPQVADCWCCGNTTVDRVAARNGLCIECTVTVQEMRESADQPDQATDEDVRQALEGVE